MGEKEKIIEEINEKGHFKIEDYGGTIVGITNYANQKFEVDYGCLRNLHVINTMLDKQHFESLTENKFEEIGSLVMCNLRFERFYTNGLDNWSEICRMAEKHVTSTVNPYNAVIRLMKTGRDEYTLETIDRNRKLWEN